MLAPTFFEQFNQYYMIKEYFSKIEKQKCARKWGQSRLWVKCFGTRRQANFCGGMRPKVHQALGLR